MKLLDAIGLGVAGNFAHHLEQAGELKDFENVKTKEPDAPKGIFPFYLPGHESFLGIYPVERETLTLPDYEANAQVEPEIAIHFHIDYDENHKVVGLHAKAFTTFNDCTIRKEGARRYRRRRAGPVTPRG